ncbi:MAG: hypothetical protein EAZ14_12125 [Runella slithyformis]|nr:MAG: hypothetical protein EAZ14_12125 [Runella slithyformis]
MFKIVSSSAGSGKTYTLTKEYLKLALQSDSKIYFKRILAITFTKAATREMKERIVSKLQVFASGADDSMLDDMVQELYPNQPAAPHKALLRQRAAQVFTQILHDYSDFAVMTIDSFTQRLVSSFTDELGMPFSFEVEMEAGELLTTAVERVLEKAGSEDTQILTEILEEFYLETANEGQSWIGLPASLADFARDLLSENRYAAIQKNKELKPADFKTIRKKIKAFQANFDQKMDEFGRAGLAIIQAAYLVEKDFSNGTVFKYFEKHTKLDNKVDWLKLITEGPGKREITAFEAHEGWYTKTAPQPLKDSIEAIKSSLTALYDQIETYRKANCLAYNLYEQIAPFLYHLSLLNEIKVEFDRQLAENGSVHISEFNKKILKIVAEEPVPFIFERLGEKFNHILIDEFQDTSKLQFANLLPLIDNSLGYQHLNLAVGDSKQAIYRFRGGDMDQIVALSTKKLGKLQRNLGDSPLTLERLGSVRASLKTEVLGTNYRSTAEIIEFNNQFFSRIAALYGEQIGLTKDVFNADFVQNVPPNAKRGGQVQFEFIEKKKKDADTDETPLMLDRTLALVRQSVESGYNLGDVAVLCRSKKHAKLVANLLKDSGYGVISEDSLSLRFSGAVNLLTAFMKVLIKPNSRLHKYESVYLLFRIILNKTPDNLENAAIKAAVEASNVREFYAYVNVLLGAGDTDETPPPLNPYQLLQLSVYELSEKLTTVFKLFEATAERDYLFRFLDVVLEFSARRGSHLSDFLEHWDVQKDKVSISAPSDPRAVTVQTIHKSKGLEYPVVIIPYADWDFTPNGKRDSMWIDLDDTDELRLPARSDGQTTGLKSGSVKLKKALEAVTEGVAEQFVEEKERIFVENLNLLYVAFTRPTQQLYVLGTQADFSKENNKKKTNYWLYQYLNDQKLYNSEQGVYCLTDTPVNVRPHAKTTVENTTYIGHVISNDHRRDLRLRRLANRVFDVETFEIKRDFAQKMRYALSLIRTPSDVETALKRLLNEGVAQPNELPKVRQQMLNLLQHPALQAVFSPEANPLNAREILTPDGKMHRPERVVRLADRVVILDYKTGKPAKTDEAALRRYSKIYREMGYAPIELILVYLDEAHQAVVIVE